MYIIYIYIFNDDLMEINDPETMTKNGDLQ